jgi:Ca-activated chloride channel homolog
MHFGNENLFWPLTGVCLGVLALALWAFWRDRLDLSVLGEHNFVLKPMLVFARRLVKGALLLVSLLLVSLGVARLQGKPEPEDLRMSGIDVMVVLDVSKSMLTQDIVPNRLEASVRAVLNWLSGREGDRVGLVVFAGEAIVQVPLTLDLQAVSQVLSRADVNAVDRGGTDIGKGIETALNSFPKDNPNQRGRAILIMTDGENTEGASDVTGVCQQAKEMNVPIVTVGVGTRRGRPIPDGVSFWGEPVYKRNESGNVVVSRLDEKTLNKIADMTGGVFVQGDSPQELASVDEALSGLARTEIKGKGAVKRHEMAPSLGAWAAGALLLSCLI